MRTRVDSDEVPWDDARRVARTLVARGIVDVSPTLEGAEVAFVRSGVKGPNGSEERWVDEILFETTPRVDGLAVVDAGLRIGVTPTREVSSVRLTGIVTEPVGTVTLDATAEALRAAFAAYLVESSPPFESIQVEMRRPVYMLDPGANSQLVAPRYLISYSIILRDGDTLVSSRNEATLWSMTSSEPMVEVVLPPG
ncbi:hypothetical protein [Paraliomyxa miuraensis]|uniref:hypothetical protein n=1 Tax=Paraliomyxa miuraensis TaxID=376150 RepID=UPI002254E3F6|nr:hypothetical protein [Paraliomyxa miuraensis]MCX4244409.1 hypothetical protein [Paraliomyxa miuraensis]